MSIQLQNHTAGEHDFTQTHEPSTGYTEKEFVKHYYVEAEIHS